MGYRPRRAGAGGRRLVATTISQAALLTRPHDRPRPASVLGIVRARRNLVCRYL